MRKCLELAEHDDFKDVLAERIEPLDSDLESDDALDNWMMREATTGQHISATCKMGPSDDPMAVVDQHGRVHGLEGLRVVDASIMPGLHTGEYERDNDDDRGADSGVDWGGGIGG